MERGTDVKIINPIENRNKETIKKSNYWKIEKSSQS